ncbi:DUF2637 domain-containing protein [Streptomyces armeniacus]|uniref:DUF2637 domain-containing protein n=1 Tax=Streptomyces armeniacus TaxID=83291 RepID=A0A345XW70_9ACTN|nr:DUF2637 domain-containing protein [Streptomyces armeniacus]AXK35886.1 DUF2637 domain-containing protein [Streptomyces armeniacus]
MPEPLSPQQLRSVERTLSLGTWTITAGAVLFSVLTVTPLVERVSPPGWEWTAPILPLVVDAAVVIVVRLDAVLARLGGNGGPWPAVLRWMTGLMTLLLNTADSALRGDMVGTAVHAVAPLLLIVTAEATRAYREALARTLGEIERSRAAAAAERERQRQQVRERERESRERTQREAREHAERTERERADREAAERREEREHAAQMRREEWAREDQRRQEREHAERELWERKERAQATRAVREQARPAFVNSTNDAVNGHESREDNAEIPAPEKLAEDDARAFIRDHMNGGISVRQLADATGWSVGWVATRLQEFRGSDRVPS